MGMVSATVRGRVSMTMPVGSVGARMKVVAADVPWRRRWGTSPDRNVAVKVMAKLAGAAQGDRSRVRTEAPAKFIGVVSISTL
jgi:hypothetical protein